MNKQYLSLSLSISLSLYIYISKIVCLLIVFASQPALRAKSERQLSAIDSRRETDCGGCPRRWSHGPSGNPGVEDEIINIIWYIYIYIHTDTHMNIHPLPCHAATPQRVCHTQTNHKTTPISLYIYIYIYMYVCIYIYI